MRIRTAVLGASLAALLALPALANALTIQFTATDLTDIVLGKDLWKYTYTVSGGPVNANEGFTIYFDYLLYSDLQQYPLPPNIYDALALLSPASLADPFTVEFVWLGGSGTTPGAQPFQTYTCTEVQSRPRPHPTVASSRPTWERHSLGTMVSTTSSACRPVLTITPPVTPRLC